MHSSADTTISIDALVRDASNGDQQAIERLLPPTLVDAAFAYVRHQVPTQEVAEDVLMDAIETALTNIHAFRRESSFPTWLFRICRSKVVNWHRREARQATRPPISDVLDVVEVVESRERAQAVVAACNRLRSPLREVFWLRKIQGLSAKEVADLTGLAVSSVHAYASKACTKVRRQVAKSYPELRETGVERNE